MGATAGFERWMAHGNVIFVRRIGRDEWPAYRDVRLRALHESPDAFGSTFEIESVRPDHIWAARVSEASCSGDDAPFFAVDEGKVFGLAWCKLDPNDPGLANIFQMWVAPELRGRGAGRELLRAVFAWAKDKGVRRVRLGVTVGNSPAYLLYARLGFVPVGEPEPLRAGTPLMVQYMEHGLGAA
jgi:ribosomal protein S18 acetylase RimI-like enzyme